MAQYEQMGLTASKANTYWMLTLCEEPLEALLEIH